MASSSPLELFVCDVLDVTPGEARATWLAPGTGRLFRDGNLALDGLLASPELRANLAFHEAWRAAIGTAPTRLEAQDFAQRRRSKPALQALQALQECLLDNTPLRAFPDAAQEAIRRAAEAHGRAEAGGDTGVSRRLLVTKLADRFGLGRVAAAAAATEDAMRHGGLVDMYFRMATDVTGLASFESWAQSPNPEFPAPVASPAHHYRRAAAAIEALGLLHTSPFTGATLERPGEAGGPLSCTEALRRSLMRDGYLWRTDAGGALVVIGGNSATPPLVPVRSVRTVQAPSACLIPSLPSGLYSRVLLVGGGKHPALDLPAGTELMATEPPYEPGARRLLVGMHANVKMN